jgi:hypothetical protein
MRRIMKKHVQMVLQKLRDTGLCAKLEKCVFHQSQLEFLDYILSREGLSIDPKKIQAIVEWRKLKIVRDVLCLFSFTNFF